MAQVATRFRIADCELEMFGTLASRRFELRLLKGNLAIHSGDVWAPGMLVIFRAEVMPGRERADTTFLVKELLPKGSWSSGRKRAASETSDREIQTRWEPTTLDCVHAAMLLQSSGRANALRALFETEQERRPDFLCLANALSALYPRDSEEKRLLDAMLLAAPR
jgi:hypothetical protein